MAKMKIGVVTSKFNLEITEKLEHGALEYLQEQAELLDLELWAVRVPGAVEIPLACQALFAKGCQGVVALGAVIRGGTAHFEYVCQSVERALTELIIANEKPIGFGVLTVDNWEQAADRAGGKHGNKGQEAAQAVVEMLALLKTIKGAKMPSFMDVQLSQDAEMELTSAAVKRNAAKSRTVRNKTLN